MATCTFVGLMMSILSPAQPKPNLPPPPVEVRMAPVAVLTKDEAGLALEDIHRRMRLHTRLVR